VPLPGHVQLQDGDYAHGRGRLLGAEFGHLEVAVGDDVVGDIVVDGARDAGLDPDGLRRAFGLLESWVEEGVLPGAAALISRGGRVAGEAYVGLANRALGRPVDSATVWACASITKPFTATAAMLMVEEGVLSLDEPLHRLLPESLRAPETPFDRRSVTLRHLLAHCSGLPGVSEDNIELRRAHRPLEEFVRSYGRQPLLFAPGSQFFYSNLGILLAAEMVGRALDGTLAQEVDRPAVRRLFPFVQERILAPLGMADSALGAPPHWDERIAWVEGTGQEGQDWEVFNSAYFRRLGMPWGGLYSTPRDLVRFLDLFLPTAAGRQRIGLADGPDVASRVVSAATARAMTSVQFAPPDSPPDLAPALREMPATSPLLRAVEWGIGWEVKGQKRPHRTGELTSAGTFLHSGSSGTMVWADPELDLCCVLLTNRTLASGWATRRPRQAMFSNAVAAAAL
jgi:beta-lactamase class C